MLKKKLNQNPLVSVIINCHNGQEYLDNCIKSVLNQTYKNWEIIFFDNNSEDNSLKIIKKNFKNFFIYWIIKIVFFYFRNFVKYFII